MYFMYIWIKYFLNKIKLNLDSINFAIVFKWLADFWKFLQNIDCCYFIYVYSFDFYTYFPDDLEQNVLVVHKEYPQMIWSGERETKFSIWNVLLV